MGGPRRHRSLVEVAASLTREADSDRQWLREVRDGQGEDEWMEDARKLCPPDPVPPESPVERERRAARGMAEALKRLSEAR